MTHAERIVEELNQLPAAQQQEVLDFVSALRERQSRRSKTLRDHPAFGSWRQSGEEGLAYQEARRAEWGDPS